MQIIPSSVSASVGKTDSGSGGTLFDALLTNGSTSIRQSGGGFAALLSKAEASASPASHQPGASLRSILLEKGKAGTAPDLRDTALSAQDFESIKASLSKLGISKDMLKDLEQRAAEGGLTWNGLLGTLSEHPDFLPTTGTPQKLDTATKNDVTLFFQKLGMTPKQSSDIIRSLEKGELTSAWKNISEKLAALSPEQNITISASDAKALAKAMQMDSASTQQLVSKFAKMEGAELTPKQLSSALAEISTSIQQRQGKAETRFSALRDALKPAMEQAWERSSQLNAADARASSETQASLAVMKDSVTAKANGFSEAAVSSTGNKEVTREARTDEKLTSFTPVAEKSVTRNTQEAAASAVDKEKSALPSADAGKGKHAAVTADAAAKFSSADADGKNGSAPQQQEQGNSGSSLRSDFWAMAQNRITVLDSPGMFQQTYSAADTQHTLDSAMQQRIFDQVEQGMLRTLKNGGKQMTLKLNPEELGAVTVVLSLRNKEVSAVIRPDNAEAAKAINEQLANLRLSLENQGLKVDRLEVRQELQHQQDNRQNWQGTGQHNQTQEQAEKFLFKRRLDAMREDDATLARDVRKEMQRATNSAHVGLSVIA